MLMKLKVMHQGQGSSEVKLDGKCKIGIIYEVEVQLQPNLICRCNMLRLSQSWIYSYLYESYY